MGRILAVSIALLLAALLLPAQPAAAGTPLPEHIVYEGVIHDREKTIGTTIMLEIAGTRVGGWIQRHDFFAIDSGAVTDSGFTFTSGGNTYKIDIKASRIAYGGPDGTGDQRVIKMEAVRGRFYRWTEESDEGQRIILQTPDGEKEFYVDRPAIWKQAGPPIVRFERIKELLGKTVTFWRARTGGSYSIEVVEEPQGMNILAKLPKEKKDKKGK